MTLPQHITPRQRLPEKIHEVLCRPASHLEDPAHQVKSSRLPSVGR